MKTTRCCGQSPAHSMSLGITLYSARDSGHGHPNVPPFPHTGDRRGLSTREDEACEWVKKRRMKGTKRETLKFLARKEECGL